MVPGVLASLFLYSFSEKKDVEPCGECFAGDRAGASENQESVTGQFAGHLEYGRW